MDNLNGKGIKYIREGDFLKSSQYYVSLMNVLYRIEINLDTKTGSIIEYTDKVVLEIKANNLTRIKSKLKERLITDFKVLFEDNISIKKEKKR